MTQKLTNSIPASTMDIDECEQTIIDAWRAIDRLNRAPGHVLRANLKGLVETQEMLERVVDAAKKAKPL